MSAQLEQLMNTPREVLAKIPAAKPPPGVTPNFANPESLVPLIMVVNTTFLAIATLFLALRIYMKTWVQRKWRLEDTLLVIAYVFSALFYSSGTISCFRGKMGRHAWDLHMDTVFFPGWFYSFWITGGLALAPLGLAKISILLQYLHLFKTKPWMKSCILGGIIIMAVFYSSFSIILIVFISPWPNESLVQCITSWHVLYFAKFTPPLGIVNILFDWYVLILPIPAVLALQLSTAKKVGVLMIFLTGGLVCIASIISTIYRYKVDLSDLSVTVSYVFLWGMIEMWTGIIVACAPTVHAFWNRHAKLIRISDIFKSSISRLAGRGSSHSSGNGAPNNKCGHNPTRQQQQQQQQQQRLQHFVPEKRNNVIKPLPSLESTRPLTRVNRDGMEMGQWKSSADDHIFAQYGYVLDDDTRVNHEYSDIDVEAQRHDNAGEWTERRQLW